jgi:hypothetical protein
MFVDNHHNHLAAKESATTDHLLRLDSIKIERQEAPAIRNAARSRYAASCTGSSGGCRIKVAAHGHAGIEYGVDRGRHHGA